MAYTPSDTHPWKRGLPKPQAADPGKWKQEPDKVSPSRVPSYGPPKPVEVAPAKHSTPKYTPVHTPPTKGK